MDNMEGDPNLMRKNQEGIKSRLVQSSDSSFLFRLIKDDEGSNMVDLNGNATNYSQQLSISVASHRLEETDYLNDLQSINKNQQQKLQLVQEEPQEGSTPQKGKDIEQIIQQEAQQKILLDNFQVGNRPKAFSIICNPIKERENKDIKVELEIFNERGKKTLDFDVDESMRNKNDTKMQNDQDTSLMIQKKRSSKFKDFQSIIFWSKVNQIKLRFMKSLIMKVASVRFRHLTSKQFSFINDTAADYGYFIYENQMIFSEVNFERIY